MKNEATSAVQMLVPDGKKIQTLEDFRNIKLRTTGAWAEIAGKLGASTVTLPGAEVYTALERGVVDATEWSTPSLNEPAGFHKVAKYIIVPGIHSPTVVQEVIVNKRAWNSLSARQQGVIETACDLAMVKQWATIGDADVAAMQAFL